MHPSRYLLSRNNSIYVITNNFYISKTGMIEVIHWHKEKALRPLKFYIQGLCSMLSWARLGSGDPLSKLFYISLHWCLLLLNQFLIQLTELAPLLCLTPRSWDRILLTVGTLLINFELQTPGSRLLWSFSQFSCSVMLDSVRPHESQHARPPCLSPTPRVHPNPCPSSR